MSEEASAAELSDKARRKIADIEISIRGHEGSIARLQRQIRAIKARDAGERVTKWTLSDDDERAALDRTPFDDGSKACSTCGEPLPTEGALARHFTVPDISLYNLGYCPNSN